MDEDFHAVAEVTEDADGFASVKTDAYGEDDASATPYEMHHPHGFYSKPMPGTRDPSSGEVDASQASQVRVSRSGNRVHAEVKEDPRVVPILPSIKDGESVQYGSAWGQFVRCHKDGSISLVTTSKSAYDGTGQPLHFWIRPSGLEFVAPWGRLVFDQTGFHVQHISQAELHLGSIGGFPAPLDAVGSYFSVQAGTVDLDATMVAAGPSTGEQEAVAKAQPIITLLGELVALAATAIASSGSPAQAASSAATFSAEAAALLLTAEALLASPSLAG